MSTLAKLGDIYDSCIKGIKSSNDLYRKWSGGYSESFAPESLAQVEISRCLAGHKIFVTIEERTSAIIRDYAAGKVSNKLRQGRIDIVIWHLTKMPPRLLIEVKKANNSQSIKKDVERIRGLLMCQVPPVYKRA